MDIRTAGVIGAGTMGNGIAHVFAKNGYNIVLVDVEQRFIDRGLQTHGGKGRQCHRAQIRAPAAQQIKENTSANLRKIEADATANDVSARHRRAEEPGAGSSRCRLFAQHGHALDSYRLAAGSRPLSPSRHTFDGLISLICLNLLISDASGDRPEGPGSWAVHLDLVSSSGLACKVILCKSNAWLCSERIVSPEPPAFLVSPHATPSNISPLPTLEPRFSPDTSLGKLSLTVF